MPGLGEAPTLGRGKSFSIGGTYVLCVPNCVLGASFLGEA